MALRVSVAERPCGVQGDKRLFIRDDELEAAWKLFTPLLQEIEKSQMVRACGTCDAAPVLPPC